MFSKKSSKPSKPQSRIDSLIGAETRVEGSIKFSGGLRVDGEIRGDVVAAPEQSSTLVISEQARIEGAVSVSHLVVNGTVIGPICCSEFVELQPKARVTGDIEYSTIEIHLGAVVQGRLIHQAAAKNIELKLASSN